MIEEKSNINLILSPELVAASLKKNEADLYILWLIFRTIDKTQNSSGHVLQSDIFNIISKILGTKTTQSYKKIRLGENVYWSKFAGEKGKKSASLFSYKKIIEHLNPDMMRMLPYQIPLREFFIYDKDGKCSWKNIKSLLVSIVLARYNDMRPIAYDGVCEYTGLSRSSVYRHSRNYSGLSIMPNENIIMTSNEVESLIAKREELKNSGDKSFMFVKKYEGQYYLVNSLPNSYLLPEFNRLQIQNRAKPLKCLDKTNVQNASPKKYFTKEENIDYNNGYVYTENHSLDKHKRPVRFWKNNNA